MDVATLSNKLNETTGYVVRPNFEEKFRSTKIQEILYSCISDVLGDKKFEQDSCPEWTKATIYQLEKLPFTINIRDRLKAANMKFDRYKFIVQCVIGENRGQGVKYGCRCLWDSDTDGMAEYVYLNDSLFCAVAAFGIFYY
ncbi:unnamed protein product [Rotaria sp. Silwood1]|nr:unnamed protein product [Rotaria sp. Silwood1]CAF3770996.1 unnamed protein product [Rotaria sp. Silwood1]CAF4678156.1 unnamed protein product [Rotaria sp. Silwood1]CAF4680642.1 unnamed protein product [Rotaria sp. Silwood1]CAF4733722.1 unnamed protein product [Rotaria sp. Silwood1]